MNRGFTVLELLVAAAILAVLSAAIGTVLLHGQWSLQTQTDLTRSTEQARVAMDLLVRYLRQAGNDPFDGLSAQDLPAVTILGSDRVLINSDITGSVPSTTGNPKESSGDPDGALDSIHEQVFFSFDDDSNELTMDIGYGPEVLAENLDQFELRFFDAAGNETTDSSQVARVTIRMVPVMEHASLQTGDVYGTTISSDVFLQASVFDAFGGSPYGLGGAGSSGSDDGQSQDSGSDDSQSQDSGSEDSQSQDSGSDDSQSQDSGSDDSQSQDSSSDDSQSHDSGSDDGQSHDSGSDDNPCENSPSDDSQSDNSSSGESGE